MNKLFLSPKNRTIESFKALFLEFDNHCDGYHLDLMDGHFVTSQKLNIEIINELRSLSKKPFWVHLMAHNPKKIINKLVLNPGDILSFHYEAMSSLNDADDLADYISHKNLEPSLAISPSTSIETIAPLLHSFEHVLIMSVEPGASGQTFIKSSFAKLDDLNVYCMSQDLNPTIALDGGVTQELIPELLQHGVSDFAVTSAVFNEDDPITAAEEIMKLLK